MKEATLDWEDRGSLWGLGIIGTCLGVSSAMEFSSMDINLRFSGGFLGCEGSLMVLSLGDLCVYVCACTAINTLC